MGFCQALPLLALGGTSLAAESVAAMSPGAIIALAMGEGDDDEPPIIPQAPRAWAEAARAVAKTYRRAVIAIS